MIDLQGKNCFHHLFTGVKYSMLMAEIALTCFKKDSFKLPGCYKEAMSHKVTQGTAYSWTPLHCMMHGSDVLVCQADILEDMLDSETVTVTDMDSLKDKNVIVFGLCLGSIHPFRGRTALPSHFTYWRSTGTYV
jgi:hypothetical protein